MVEKPLPSIFPMCYGPTLRPEKLVWLALQLDAHLRTTNCVHRRGSGSGSGCRATIRKALARLEEPWIPQFPPDLQALACRRAVPAGLITDSCFRQRPA